jgi:hypothetical protein
MGHGVFSLTPMVTTHLGVDDFAVALNALT